jgi:hypothetical protein
VLVARSLDLLGGELVALDGAFFHGDASKASILTKRRLEERMAALDHSIAEYHAALTANDQAEETAAAASAPPAGEDIAEKLAALRQRRATAAADLAKLTDSGDGQLSRTDPDARLLAQHGQIVAGYNVQIAVDDKHNPGVRRGRWSTTATTPANSMRWPRRQSRRSGWRRSLRSPTLGITVTVYASLGSRDRGENGVSEK